MIVATLMGVVTLIASSMAAGFNCLQNIVIIDDLNYSVLDLVVTIGWLNLVFNIVRWILSPRGVRIARNTTNEDEREIRAAGRKAERYERKRRKGMLRL